MNDNFWHKYPFFGKGNCLLCGEPRQNSNQPCQGRAQQHQAERDAFLGADSAIIQIETVEGYILTYSADDEILSVIKPGRFGNRDQLVAEECLANKNVTAEMITKGTAGKALRASAGGLIAGATVLPVIGTVYGVARAAKRTKAAAVSMVGDGINWQFETHDTAAASHFTNTINWQTSEYR